MSVSISANLNEDILNEFRDVIYRTRGLKQGSFRKSLEEAMLEYIAKYDGGTIK